jgi:hypothetical protein
MTKVIAGLVGVALVTALNAIGVSNALAVPLCKEESGATTFRVCLFLTTTELELLEAATFAVLQEESPTPAFRVEFVNALEVRCLTGEGTMGVEVELVSEHLKFTECEVVSPEHCAIEGSGKEIGAITTEEMFGTGAIVSGKLEVRWTPAPPATEFATFSIFSSGGLCIDAQEGAKVTGEDICTFLETIEIDEPQHSLECKPEGSTLKYSGNVVTLSDEWSVLMLTPTSDASWSVVEGL